MIVLNEYLEKFVVFKFWDIDWDIDHILAKGKDINKVILKSNKIRFLCDIYLKSIFFSNQ